MRWWHTTKQQKRLYLSPNQPDTSMRTSPGGPGSHCAPGSISASQLASIGYLPSHGLQAYSGTSSTFSAKPNLRAQRSSTHEENRMLTSWTSRTDTMRSIHSRSPSSDLQADTYLTISRRQTARQPDRGRTVTAVETPHRGFEQGRWRGNAHQVHPAMSA